MTTVLRVSLTGRDAELGKVAAADFARLLIGVERVVARAAGHVIGRQVKPTGRRGRTIEHATHFRLLAVETGSVVGVLELADAPEDDETLDLEAAGLGELALDAALATITAPEPAQLDVAEAFVRLTSSGAVRRRGRIRPEDYECPVGKAEQDPLGRAVDARPRPRRLLVSTAPTRARGGAGDRAGRRHCRAARRGRVARGDRSADGGLGRRVRPEDVPPGPLLIDTDVFSWVTWKRGRHEEYDALLECHVLALSFAKVAELRAGVIINKTTTNAWVGPVPTVAAY
jgi:hypothetical protein